MKTKEQAMHQVNNFFETFAHALENFDTKTMAYLYNMPCTLLSDDTTSIFTEPAKLEGFFNQGASAYKHFGVECVKHEIWSKHRWTEKMVLAKVKWSYFNSFGELIYNCDYQYVLKNDKSNQLKIIMSISLNEREKMEEWKSKTNML